ncbi:glutamic acid-rich protein-like isoform X2 [Cloeon dipterum]|uniref:glutamic acid-rich protein-like isoform X2 n=1 Tax=Cloeon dipterum TaxID=197152 RepID=UPI0032207962
MKITDSVASRNEMAPKEFNPDTISLPKIGFPMTIVNSSFACPPELTYAEVVKLIPRIPHLSSANSKATFFAPAEKKPPALYFEYKLPSPIIDQCLLVPYNRSQPRYFTPWRFSRQIQQNNQLSRKNNRSVFVEYNWRNPSAASNQEQKMKEKNEPNSQEKEENHLNEKLLDTEQPKMDTSPADKTESLALCESSPPSMLRCLSVSSMTSEDSAVTFDRSCSPPKLEISSDEYEESEDDESNTDIEQLVDSSSAYESGVEIEKAINDGENLQAEECSQTKLPIKSNVPLTSRLRTHSSSSDSSETEEEEEEEESEDDEDDDEEDDCDESEVSEDDGIVFADEENECVVNGHLDDSEDEDDFIVFGEGSGDEEEEEKDEKREEEIQREEEESEDETDRVRVESAVRRKRYPDKIKPAKSNLKVRFAEVDDICILYDDEDYQMARVSEWEKRATDSIRFRERIANTALVLNPVLAPEHRLKIQEQLKIVTEGNPQKHTCCVVNGRH